MDETYHPVNSGPDSDPEFEDDPEDDDEELLKKTDLKSIPYSDIYNL